MSRAERELRRRAKAEAAAWAAGAPDRLRRDREWWAYNNPNARRERAIADGWDPQEYDDGLAQAYGFADDREMRREVSAMGAGYDSYAEMHAATHDADGTYHPEWL